MRNTTPELEQSFGLAPKQLPRTPPSPPPPAPTAPPSR
jgi:hypothetical protein